MILGLVALKGARAGDHYTESKTYAYTTVGGYNFQAAFSTGYLAGESV